MNKVYFGISYMTKEGIIESNACIIEFDFVNFSFSFR